MRILHLLDMAFIAQITSYFLNKRGIKSDCFITKNPIPKYNAICYRQLRYLIKDAILKAKNYDIIHIHSVELLVPIFKFLGKKVVLHYHGSDILSGTRSKSIIRNLCRRMADIIIYNSNDMYYLLKRYQNVYYLPNLVDDEIFQPHSKGIGNLAIISSNNLDVKKTLAKLPKDCEILDSCKQKIPYEKMPEFLSKYSTFIDEKITDYDHYCTQLSTTALQALSCGLTVIHDSKTIEKLPDDNKPENYIKKLVEIYNLIP